MGNFAYSKLISIWNNLNQNITCLNDLNTVILINI